MFIVFEGIDGSSKTTQINLLGIYFYQNNKKYTVLKEPGSTDLGSVCRQILLKGEIDKRAELALFFAARAENVAINILNNTDYVLCDRFVESTVAYQCYGNQSITEEELQPMLKFFSYNVVPDITFVLDVDYETSRKRMKNRTNNFYDEKEEDYFNKVQTYYRSLKKENYFYIDTTHLTEEETHQKILQILQNFTQK